MPKVSVIVPVFNPGPHIEDCVGSAVGQSLPASDVEIVLVDDGSTDGTAARLDELAARHANVRVAHIPNSGWPGRPRNVGLDMARGEYVLFMDNDDRLGREALERMVAMADADGADVLTGKVVGHGKSVTRALFRGNRSQVTLDWPPLAGLLTPHKLFRRAFLLEHGLRFPEGHYRLEDYAFVLPAYFRARSISVLADYPCYHWVLRDREVNASTKRFDAADYFRRLREILDIVVAHTEPGELRERLLTHLYAQKMLSRMGGPSLLSREEGYRLELYEEIRRLTLERFGPEHDALVGLNLRLRAHLLREGRLADLLALAAREAELEARVTRLAFSERDGGGLTITMRGRLGGGSDGPLAFARDGDRLRWVAPAGLRFDDARRDATEALERGATAHVIVRSVQEGVEYLLPARVSTRLIDLPDATDQVRVQARIRAALDPATAAGGAPLPPGDWDVDLRLAIAGFRATAPVPGARLHVTADGQVRR